MQFIRNRLQVRVQDSLKRILTEQIKRPGQGINQNMAPRNFPGSESILTLIQEMRSDYEIVTNPKSRFNIQEEFEGLAAYGLSAKDNNAEIEGRERAFSYENEVGGSGSKFRRDFTS